MMRNAAKILLLIAALGLILVGLVVGGSGIVMGLLGGGAEGVLFVTFSLSLLACAAGLGLVLAWHAIQSIRGRPSARFAPRRVWPLAVLFFLVVALGHSALSATARPELAFPPLHVLASALPPWIVVLLVARGLASGARWRDVALQLSSGGLLATSLAGIIEMFLIGAMLAGLGLAYAIRPENMLWIDALMAQAGDPATLENPLALLGAVPLPALAALGLLLASILAPLVEEPVKTIGLPLLAWRRPTRPESFLWGVAGGAGFALTEGMLNSLTGLDAWAPGILIRTGATVLHCLTGGLMGLAWHAALRQRAGRRALALLGASLATHSLWNTLAVGMALVSLDASGTLAALSGRALAGLLVLLALAVTIALALVTGAVRDAGPGPDGPAGGEPAARGSEGNPGERRSVSGVADDDGRV
jgi:RsiW-degrading membrane proteinase PrsW (M82 family)